MRKALFYVIGFFCPYLAMGQTTNILYPDLYTVYDANMYMVNPAYVPKETKTDLTAFYKFQTGAFKDVATMAFSAAKLYERENEAIHSIRLSVTNEKQGPYISSPRAYANYAYELPLGLETRLALGLSFGFAGMNYSGMSTGNVNTFLPDGAGGLVFTFREFRLGVSGQQLLDTKSKPFSSQIELKRYYHVHFSHQLDITEGCQWKYYGLYRYLPNIPNELLVGTQLLFQKTFGIGAVARSNAGMSIYAEIALDSERDRLKLVLNYNSSFFKLIPTFQDSMELGVGYVLK